MSFLTQSHQAFFGRPLCLILSTSHIIQRLTQLLLVPTVKISPIITSYIRTKKSTALQIFTFLQDVPAKTTPVSFVNVSETVRLDLAESNFKTLRYLFLFFWQIWKFPLFYCGNFQSSISADANERQVTKSVDTFCDCLTSVNAHPFGALTLLVAWLKRYPACSNVTPFFSGKSLRAWSNLVKSLE